MRALKFTAELIKDHTDSSISVEQVTNMLQFFFMKDQTSLEGDFSDLPAESQKDLEYAALERNRNVQTDEIDELGVREWIKAAICDSFISQGHSSQLLFGKWRIETLVLTSLTFLETIGLDGELLNQATIGNVFFSYWKTLNLPDAEHLHCFVSQHFKELAERTIKDEMAELENTKEARPISMFEWIAEGYFLNKTDNFFGSIVRDHIPSSIPTVLALEVFVTVATRCGAARGMWIDPYSINTSKV